VTDCIPDSGPTSQNHTVSSCIFFDKPLRHKLCVMNENCSHPRSRILSNEL